MQQRYTLEAEIPISLLGDADGIETTGDDLQQTQKSGSVAAHSPRQSLNPRIQFLRLSAVVRGRQGTPGATPPYQPAAPSLYRFPAGDQEIGEALEDREPSPLRNLLYSNWPHLGYESSRQDNITHRPKFPNVNSTFSQRPKRMPQTGFQALILCGPGIGLSTFTSVPAEFPKALVEVANRPMVWYVLDWCYRMGVTDITLITPPTSKAPIAAALAQNPYLTSLPSPSPDLLAPQDLEFTTPTAELIRLPEVQAVIQSDFLLLPCDLICGISGDVFLETYLTRLGGPGGIGSVAGLGLDGSRKELLAVGGENRGRRGGLSIWYNTIDREESVKGEECDFMCTTKLDAEHDIPLSKSSAVQQKLGTLRKLVWAMPMSELWDQTEQDKSWKIRHSLLRKHGAIKCMTKYRDSHIYVFPYWVKDFAKINEEFESVSEDLVGTWAKAEWRKPSYRAQHGARKIFSPSGVGREDIPTHERPIEEEIDLLSLSSTQISTLPPTQPVAQHRSARLASRVQADPEDSILSPDNQSDTAGDDGPVPTIPPILSYILPSSPDAALVRRVDNTPLLLSVSLSLAKLPSIEESQPLKQVASPFAHQAKIHPTTTVAPRVTISRFDTLIDSNSTIATQCVIKSSVIGASVAIGTGTRITGCVIMDGVTIGDKCVLTNTVVGKKAKIGSKSTLQNCEVQDGNVVADGTEGKGEKYLIGGLEDDVEGEDEMGFDDDDGQGSGDDGGEGVSDSD